MSVLLAVLSPSEAYSDKGDAGQPGEFLRYGVGVRSLAMGRASVALGGDAGDLYCNPACLMHVKTRYSAYFMHFKPFYESSYSFASVALPRPNREVAGLGGLLFGPETAWGVAAVNMGTNGFECRDSEDMLLDENFGLFQQAFIVGFAREFTGASGILGCGLTLKLIRQGIRNAEAMPEDSDMGFGLDVGAQLQMINPPLIKGLVSLRNLLPLTLGLSIHNAVSPKVGYGGEADRYPSVLRLGWSYKIENRLLPDGFQLVLVNDYEWMFRDLGRLLTLDRAGQRDAGVFLGSELTWQAGDLALSPRLGICRLSGTTKGTVGFGVTVSKEKYSLQFDFAHGRHEELSDDQRFSVTINLGRKRDADYFYDDKPTILPRKKRVLHVVAGYPSNMDKIKLAAGELATQYDASNARRYWELIEGLDWANQLYEEAKSAHQSNDVSAARDKALQAAAEYENVFRTGRGEFEDMDLLNFGETWMMADRWEDATRILDEARDGSLRKHYLLGLSYEMTGTWKQAAIQYAVAASARGRDEKSMRLLSALGLGRSLMEKGQPDSARVVLGTLTASYDAPLRDDYPRYQVFGDRNIADDAQYLIGVCHLITGNRKEAAAAWVSICRFYPDLDMCRDTKVQEETEELIQELKKIRKR